MLRILSFPNKNLDDELSDRRINMLESHVMIHSIRRNKLWISIQLSKKKTIFIFPRHGFYHLFRRAVLDFMGEKTVQRWHFHIGFCFQISGLQLLSDLRTKWLVMMEKVLNRFLSIERVLQNQLQVP